jgi:hypothetical protein
MKSIPTVFVWLLAACFLRTQEALPGTDQEKQLALIPDPPHVEAESLKQIGKKSDAYPPHIAQNKLDVTNQISKGLPHVDDLERASTGNSLGKKRNPRVKLENKEIDDDFLKAFESMFANDGMRLFSGPAALRRSTHSKSAQEKQTEVKLDEHYKIHQTPMTFTLDSDLKAGEFIAVQLYGMGTAVVEAEADQNSKEKLINSTVLSFQALGHATYIPISSATFGKKGHVLKIAGDPVGFFSDWSFSVQKLTHFETDYESGVKILGGFASSVDILVTKNSTNETSAGDKRTQFILTTSLDKQDISGEEELKMLVNFNKTGFPTENSFDFKPSGSLGSGLVKTLTKAQPFYCASELCQYRVRIWARGISEVVFYVSEMEIGASLKFNRSLVLVEEIEPGEHIWYKLEVPQDDENIVFTLTPLEGKTQLYVSPDFLPDEISKYKYWVKSERTEQIIITETESQKFNFTKKLFFVRFESDSQTQPATFRFQVSKHSPEDKFYIQENTAQGGVVAIDEIINYVVDFQNFGTETEDAMDVKINFDTYFGNADVYVKECQSSSTHCRVTPKDIDNYLDLTSKKDSIFQYRRYDDGQSLTKKSPDGKDDHYSGNIHLKFNCLPFFNQLRNQLFGLSTGFEGKSTLLSNGLHSSSSCQFAIAVHCRDSPNKFGAAYKLILSGDNVHRELLLVEPATLKFPPNWVEYFRLKITPFDLMRYDGVRFKLMTVEGDYSVAFSADHKYPNSTTGVSSMTISDEHYATLKVITNTTELNFTTLFNMTPEGVPQVKKRAQSEPQKKFFVNKEGKIEKVKPAALQESPQPKKNKFFAKKSMESHNIYMTVAARKYTVLELYIEPIPKSQSKLLIDPQVLPPGTLVHRSIDFLFQYFKDDQKNTVYYSNFLYRDALKSAPDSKNPVLKLTLNSKSQGLRMCVQVGSENFSIEKPCDYSSESGVVNIKKAQYDFLNDPKIVISVQKIIDFERAMDILPVDFSLLASISGTQLATELKMNGKPFTSMIESYQMMIFEIDLRNAQKNALILFDSESITTRAEFGYQYMDSFFSLENLDHKNYGVQIKDVKKFCERYQPDSECFVRVYVYSRSKSRSKFSVTYTIDDKPFVLKEGDFLAVPSQQEHYFVYEVSGRDALSFSVYSTETKGVLYSAGLSHPSLIKKQLTPLSFSYKTDIQNFVQITHTPADLAKLESNVIGYFYEPKFSASSSHFEKKKEYTLLKGAQRARVVAKTQVAELIPFYDLPETCAKGDFRYYHVASEEGKEFSVILSSISGKVDLLVNKGRSRLPTLNNHDLRETCKKGREVEINNEILKNTSGKSENYMVGVFCETHAHFSLIYLPTFPGFIRLQFQKLMDIPLKAGKEYFFDFFNQHERYHTLLYSEESDIKVSALDFRVSKKKNILEMISEPKNWKEQFVFRHGSNPRKHFSENSVEKDNHIIIKMEAIDRDAQVNFLIYDPAHPIVIPAEKRVHYGMGDGDNVTFMCHLNAEYEDLEFVVKLEHGELDIWISETLADLDDTSKASLTHYKINKYEQVSHIFQPSSSKVDANDILLFNHVYVRVQAHQLSNFWMSLHPKDKMRMARINEPELVRSDPAEDVYLYFPIEEEDKEAMKSLEIHVETVRSFAQMPTFLFNSNDKIDFNSEKLLPMFIDDLQRWEDHEFLHITVKPKIESGSYIIKIPPHLSQVPYKITYIVDSNKPLTPNDYIKGYLRSVTPNDGQKYSVFLPHKGEFRIVLETCDPIDIPHAQFFPAKNFKKSYTPELPRHLVQGFPYLAIKTNPGQPSTRELREFEYPVYRILIESPGLMEFTVKSKKDRSQEGQASLSDYFLMTEFIPHHKELVLKDFVSVINPTSELDKYVTGHRYVNSGSDLEVSTKFPSFKPQLLVDYPKVKKIQITLIFSLFATASVEEILKRCGISSLFLLNNVSKNVTRVFNISDIDTEHMPSYVSTQFTREEDKSLGNQGVERTVFSHARIRFIEDENDEYDLTLDEKLTLVPYFLMDISPRPLMTVSVIYYIVAGVMLGLVVAGCLIYKCSSDEPESKPAGRFGYEAPRNGEFATDRRLEMSSISAAGDK